MCGFVVTVGGGRRVLGEEKNGKKRGMCGGGAGCWCEQPKRMLRALGQTYVRQSLLVAPPTLYPFGLVAVAVLADTMFELVRCSRCFST